MLYIGRFMLGDTVPIKVVTRNSSRVATAPTAAPTIRFYDSSGSAVLTTSMPIYQKNIRTGTFLLEQFLSSTFSAGRYTALIEYTISASSFKTLRHFQIIAGGNAQGSYLAMHFYQPPHANYVVGITEDGTTDRRKNPRT